MKSQHYLILLSFLFLLNSCHVGRFFYWNFADTGDLDKFESVPIQKGEMKNTLMIIPKLQTTPLFLYQNPLFLHSLALLFKKAILLH